jgi:hypothetical protein
MQSLIKQIAHILDRRYAKATDYVILSVQRHGAGALVAFEVQHTAKGRPQYRAAFFKDRGETLVSDIICA